MSAPSVHSMPQAHQIVDKLRDTVVGVRDDLEVTRHCFRGVPCYVIRDPMTFQNQRMSVADYELFISIDDQRRLHEVFEDLVDRAKLMPQDEVKFYEFVVVLHRLGFLRLPISDHKMLYRRRVLKDQAKKRGRVLGWLFCRVRLLNPSLFLDRTAHRVSWLFTWPSFAAWCVLMLIAGVVITCRWADVVQPINGLLVAQNLVMMWFLLVGLKVIHEFGHAYACKHYGGNVPEMGVYLIVLTPCAYMDATASWGFASKRHRMIVCLAGMYVESVVAALATIVWASTQSGLINSAAFNTMFLASVVTVLFNINPLMRYDGYYLLSDLVEVPNLRQRASDVVNGLAKRLFLRLETTRLPKDRRMCLGLASYGIASMLYRAVLMVSIAALVVAKLYMVGVVVAGLLLVSMAGGTLRRLMRYLWTAEETAPIRRRAVLTGMAAVVGLPVLVLVCPVPSAIEALAVVRAEQEQLVHTRQPGFVRHIAARPGEVIGAGARLIDLENDNHEARLAEARARLESATIRRDAYRATDPSRAIEETEWVKLHEQEAAWRQQQRDELDVRSTSAGTLVAVLGPHDLGRFLPSGMPVATIVGGRSQIVALMTQAQVAAANVMVGDRATFRSAVDPAVSHGGVVSRVAPAGQRAIVIRQLTHLAGGDIAVDPHTNEATEPYFELVIDLESQAIELPHGATGRVRIGRAWDSVARRVLRGGLRFMNRLLER